MKKAKKYITIDDGIDYELQARFLLCDTSSERTKRLKKWCALHTRRIPVYSVYDCTGQLCGVYYKVTPFDHGYLFTISLHYDY